MLIIACTMSHAATLLKYRNESPKINVAGLTIPSRVDTISLWVENRNVRTSEFQNSYYLYIDSSKMLFRIFPKFNTYTVTYLSEKDLDSISKADTSKFFESGLAMLEPKSKDTVVVTDSFKTINGYHCRKYVSVSEVAGISKESTDVWATDDIQLDNQVLQRIGNMAGSQPPTGGDSPESNQIKGVHVLEIGHLEVNSAEIKIPKTETKKELLEFKEVQVPGDWFMVPKGYELYPPKSSE